MTPLVCVIVEGGIADVTPAHVARTLREKLREAASIMREFKLDQNH